MRCTEAIIDEHEEKWLTCSFFEDGWRETEGVFCIIWNVSNGLELLMGSM